MQQRELQQSKKYIEKGLPTIFQTDTMYNQLQNLNKIKQNPTINRWVRYQLLVRMAVTQKEESTNSGESVSCTLLM